MEINRRSGKAIRAIGIEPAYPLIIGNISQDSPAAKAGLRQGDQVLQANGESVYSVSGLNAITLNFENKPLELTIKRDDKVEKVTVTPQTVPISKPLLKITNAGLPNATAEIIPVYPGEGSKSEAIPTSLEAPAALLIFNASDNSALKDFTHGTQIEAVNGRSVTSLESLQQALQNNAAKQTELRLVSQDGEAQNIQISNPLESEIVPAKTRNLIGFSIEPGRIIIHPSPIEQISNQISLTLTFIDSLISPSSDIGINQLSGPVGIARVLHTFSLEDLRLAIWFSVLLNINLGILNLLPIPVLDGGHMLIATISKLMRRQIPPQLVAGMQGAFMFVLFGLMFYVMFNDSLDWIGDHEAEQRIDKNQMYYIPVNFEKQNE